MNKRMRVFMRGHWNYTALHSSMRITNQAIIREIEEGQMTKANHFADVDLLSGVHSK